MVSLILLEVFLEYGIYVDEIVHREVVASVHAPNEHLQKFPEPLRPCAYRYRIQVMPHLLDAALHHPHQQRIAVGEALD